MVASAYGKEAKLPLGFNYFLTNVTYGAPVSYPVANRVYDILFADFNGDKKLDMFVPDESGAQLFLGVGDGTFGAGTAVTTGLTAPGFSKAVDFNGDGKLDLVVASGAFAGSDASVAVLLGKGDGTFDAAVAYAVPAKSQGVAVGDFTGDKKLDIAVGLVDGTVVILTGQGNGIFVAGSPFVSGVTNVRDLVLGDFDGDKKLDLAVTAYPSLGLSILLGKGDGTFATGVTYGTGGYFKGDAADVNKDGKADLVMGSVFAGGADIFINNGDGTFAASTNFACGGLTADAKLYDVDLDGTKDLVCADYYGEASAWGSARATAPSRPR